MHIDFRAPAQPAKTTARKRRRTPGEKLIEALVALANGEGVVLKHNEKNWASITFAGTRHRVEMVFEGEQAVEAGENFIAVLPDHEFAIPAQLVADAEVVEACHQACPPQLRVCCELLMLVEG